jgi:predicted deacylase
MSHAAAPRVSRRLAMATLLLFTTPSREPQYDDHLIFANRTGTTVEVRAARSAGPHDRVTIEPGRDAWMSLHTPQPSLCGIINHETVFRDNFEYGIAFYDAQRRRVDLTCAELRARSVTADSADGRNVNYHLTLGPDFFAKATPP